MLHGRKLHLKWLGKFRAYATRLFGCLFEYIKQRYSLRTHCTRIVKYCNIYGKLPSKKMASKILFENVTRKQCTCTHSLRNFNIQFSCLLLITALTFPE